MRARQLETPEAVAAAAADLLAEERERRPDLVLGLPTGRTPVAFYGELQARHRRGELDLSRARGFNLDELLLPPDHTSSFHVFMARHVWGHTGLGRARCDIPDPEAEPEAECRRYERALAAAGGFDLAFLGVGADGHVAYNLPGPPRGETHVVELPDAEAASQGVPPAERPLRAITVGMGALRSARRLVLMALSADKAPAVRSLLDGPADPRWPCSLLRDHPALDVLITPEVAASGPEARP
jgi:glucosamine-6-phosphate deaminase